MRPATTPCWLTANHVPPASSSRPPTMRGCDSLRTVMAMERRTSCSSRLAPMTSGASGSRRDTTTSRHIEFRVSVVSEGRTRKLTRRQIGGYARPRGRTAVDHLRRRPCRGARQRLDRPASRQVPGRRPPHRPGSDGRDHLRGRQAHGAARHRGVAHRLVVLRGAPSTPPAARRGRRRAPRRGDHHRGHLRGHAPGCLPGQASARGHGHQPSRGVAVLPDLPPVLRTDLHRGRRQGARPSVRQGLQRLDGRRVVCGVGRPADPAVPHPLVGRQARRCRGATERGPWGEGGVLQRDPTLLGAAVGARPRQLLGPVLRGLRRDQDRDQHAHRLVVEDALDLR